MSMYRVALFALVALFTAATTSIASADCCGGDFQAPITYAPAGCGGCGAPSAAIIYAQPVAPAPPVIATGTWGGGCGCHRAFVYAATPAIEVVPVQSAPIYVINQGPEYTGPGIMAPYHTWAPGGAYVAPGGYPYMAGGGYYGPRPPYFGPRRIAYRTRYYGHPIYHGRVRVYDYQPHN